MPVITLASWAIPEHSVLRCGIHSDLTRIDGLFEFKNRFKLLIFEHQEKQRPESGVANNKEL
jgi:hypothetical protein